MNMSMQLAVVMAAVCLCLVSSAPEGRLTRTKQQRPTRGFKNVEMMTARGFGKRDRPHARSERDVDHQVSSERASRGTPTFKSPTVGIARDFGKRTPESETGDHDFGASSRKKFNPKTNLMVAYDFGKRSGNDENIDEEEEIRVTRGTFKPNSNVLIARGYGKRAQLSVPERVYGLDNFWDLLESSPDATRDIQDGNDEKPLESIPVDWFVSEMLNNPDFARSVVRKFIDVNQDGMLTSEELLRNVV